MKGPLRRALRTLLTVGVLAAAGCGDKNGDTAAYVGATAISEKQVDAIIEHARDEASREGTPFPREGTEAYDVARRTALDLLVYHEELAQRAKALGVTPSPQELTPPAAIGESAEGASSERAFVRESVRGAVLYRKIYDRVTRGVSVSDREIRAYYRAHPDLYRDNGLSLDKARPTIRKNLLDTKRNALMARWVAEMRRNYVDKVRYVHPYRLE
jgi:SurA-like protein